MNAIETINARVTSGKLVEPAPDDGELRTILHAALRAPDHGRLRPWSFLIVKGQGLSLLGEAMAESLRSRKPDASADELVRERAKPMRAPLIVVAAARIRKDTHIPRLEQIASAAAATQNLLLAATALGYGSAWKTGDAAHDTSMNTALGLGQDDAILGFIYLGTNERSLPQRDQIDYSGIVRNWPVD